jgi:hypothetical protein
MRLNRAVRFALLLALVAFLMLAMMGCGDFFVSENAIDHVDVTPPGVLLKTGDMVSLSASAVQVGGTSSVITSSADWTTSSAATATVDNSSTKGQVTAGSTAGTVTITAKDTTSNVSGTSTVVVTTSTLPTELSIRAASSLIPLNQTVKFQAVAVLSGSEIDVSNIVTWTSDNSAVATVDKTGNVTGLAACGPLQGNLCPSISASLATATSTITGKQQIATVQ